MIDELITLLKQCSWTISCLLEELEDAGVEDDEATKQDMNLLLRKIDAQIKELAIHKSESQKNN